ncbi:hypothetical protein PPERSA_08710 [Pseudocohnilembus persalinus]|uniref:Prokaryotic-type class I peptide chain release factors domain-containing protein n=1 Tax=Pseudocohnilembus persalinus TaxID=266149 RepID=A0A0V0R899_PSEPJ|nr:hypothetical protein PPERSA_08710 [Pseudocohnilembus persalinus]|eukprot:KRX10715.1 hypothetical protein PPERSA_08710 [Pseudocohnilembus persalinus]
MNKIQKLCFHLCRQIQIHYDINTKPIKSPFFRSNQFNFKIYTCFSDNPEQNQNKLKQNQQIYDQNSVQKAEDIELNQKPLNKLEILRQQKHQHKKNQQELSQKRVQIKISEKDLEWSFIRGGGKGGQKVNKTSNCALLKHVPTGIQVKSHQSRDLEANKNYCLKKLKEKLDEIQNQEFSKKNVKIQKQQKQKAKAKKRAQEKYLAKNAENPENSQISQNQQKEKVIQNNDQQ